MASVHGGRAVTRPHLEVKGSRMWALRALEEDLQGLRGPFLLCAERRV